MPASLPLVAVTLTLLSQAESAPPVAPTQTESCRAETLADLRRCVSADDLILVATTGQDVIRGRYKGIVHGLLLVETGGTRVEPVRAFTDEEVVEVAVFRPRRRASDLARSATSAGLFGALLGTESVDRQSYGIFVGLLTGIGVVANVAAPPAYPEPVYRRAGPDKRISAIADTLALRMPLPVAFDDLPQRIQSGQRIRLRDASNAVILGRFAGIDNGRLVVYAGKEAVRVPEHEIRTLERRVRAYPSKRRAAAVGAAVTTALLALSWAVATPAERDRDPLTPGVVVTGAVTGAVVGVGLAETLGRYRYEPVGVKERIPTKHLPTDTRRPRSLAHDGGRGIPIRRTRRRQHHHRQHGRIGVDDGSRGECADHHPPGDRGRRPDEPLEQSAGGPWPRVGRPLGAADQAA